MPTEPQIPIEPQEPTEPQEPNNTIIVEPVEPYNNANSMPDQLSIPGLASEHLAGFDPSIHAVDKNTGQPIVKADGTFARKRGRKTGAKNNAPETEPETETETMPEEIPREVPKAVSVTSEQAAKTSANLLFNIGVMIFGEVGKPVDKDEAFTVKNAFKDYYDAKGVVEIPPEISLLIVVGGYGIGRYHAAKQEAPIHKIKAWFFNLFKRKQKPHVEIAPETVAPKKQMGGALGWTK